ncbi:hypothetical protein SAMN05192575_111116 [Nocardioides alpinus]|uniref:Uncharacterized protein n=1 Tax=Nocardioides alpinus TaxID=748909 RepID=A0A1I1AX12_9ACTN|nr:hypothetical protein [Nocardioides alpinus]PKH40982.1 hypothetical protein CXG46_11040 [Nocardioides alpinus]SFB42591.1 hypothetical protein SAMN05192575_111116 [Nocardioides alpinus]
MSTRLSAHPRRTWAIFGSTCVLALGAAVVAALNAGGPASVGLTFLGGAIVVGLAAALMYAIASPQPDSLSPFAGSRGGWGDGSGGGFGDGGGGGGGGGGGDGGC